MSKEISKQLAKCPFCGGEARVNIFLGNYCVTCENCMGAIFPARGMTEEEAIKAWNTRKPIERIVERLEEEKKFYNSASYTDQAIRQGVMIATEIVREEGKIWQRK